MWTSSGRGIDPEEFIGPPRSEPPLRLAFVSHCVRAEDHSAGRIGGAERAASELLSALRRRDDVEVTPVVSNAETDPLRFVGFAADAVFRLRRLAADGLIDAILFTAMPTAWMSWTLSSVLRRSGVVSAAICHGHDVTMAFPPYQDLVQRTFGALDAVMPVSRATGEHCLVRGLDPRRLHVTPNGADATRFAPPPAPGARRAVLRQAYPDETAGLTDNALVVCSVGRQVRRKGHAWFAGQPQADVVREPGHHLAGEPGVALAPDLTADAADHQGVVGQAGGLDGEGLPQQ